MGWTHVVKNIRSRATAVTAQCVGTEMLKHCLFLHCTLPRLSLSAPPTSAVTHTHTYKHTHTRTRMHVFLSQLRHTAHCYCFQYTANCRLTLTYTLFIMNLFFIYFYFTFYLIFLLYLCIIYITTYFYIIIFIACIICTNKDIPKVFKRKLCLIPICSIIKYTNLSIQVCLTIFVMTFLINFSSQTLASLPNL